MSARIGVICLVFCALSGGFSSTCGTAKADLSTEFVGFTLVNEVGVSGQVSSCYAEIRAGDNLPDSMFALGPGRVTYPSGVGQVPSPGGSMGRVFDEGVMGVRIDGDDLVIRAAGGLDPLSGYYHSGWRTWYGQGDVFVTVEDATVRHFALLNAWPRNGSGTPIALNGRHFEDAQAFHVQGGAGATSLEGRLVRLTQDDQVALVGGPGSYYPSYSRTPAGLDFRAYAAGGDDLGDAGLTHTTTTDFGLGGVKQTWHIQTWTVPIEWLSTSPVFTLGLHKATSCGNDQIGLLTEVTTVPAPPAVALGAIGITLAAWLKRRR